MLHNSSTTSKDDMMLNLVLKTEINITEFLW
jgi:hypothetical protein